MNRNHLTGLAVAALVAVLTGQAIEAEVVDGHAQRAGSRQASPARPAAEPVPPASPAGVKVIRYTDKEVVPVRTKLKYSTLIVLPKDEQILDYITGDRDFWIINGAENLAYVKPAMAGSATNLNLVTASGNVYSFTLSEVSQDAKALPDLKVFVELADPAMAAQASGKPKFVSSQAIDDFRQQVEIAKEETRQTKDDARAEIDRGISQFVSNVRFPYRFEAGKKPFGVRAMYNDDKFTYIQARPEETPTLYEIKDGKPNLVNFEYRNGVYVVTKILSSGYLVIGNQKLNFTRED